MWEADDEPTVNELLGSWFLRCQRTGSKHRGRPSRARDRKREELAV